MALNPVVLYLHISPVCMPGKLCEILRLDDKEEVEIWSAKISADGYTDRPAIRVGAEYE